MMNDGKIQRIETISAFHKIQELPEPDHPLISVVNVEDLRQIPEKKSLHLIYDFYLIALKKNCSAKFRYGQQEYDFDEGVMIFVAPDQVFGIEYYEEELAKR